MAVRCQRSGSGCYTSRKAGRWNWLLHKQEVSGSWKLAATQAGKLEGGTGCYTSRRCLEAGNWLLHKQESWKLELAAIQAGGVWVFGI